MKYPSTILPQTNDPVEIQKGNQDLLEKINETHDLAAAASVMQSQTDETLYTPTISGVGVVSNINMHWLMIGNRCFVSGRFQCGNPPGGIEFRLSLPASKTSDVSLISAIEICGVIVQNIAQAVGYYALIEPGKGYITVGLQNAGNDGLTKQNGSTFGNGAIVSVHFDVPV